MMEQQPDMRRILEDYEQEKKEKSAKERTRWRVIAKLRNRRRKQQRQDMHKDQNRLERFRRNYEIAAHFLIDVIADTEDDPELRELRRTRLEQRMRVSRRGVSGIRKI